MTSKTADSPRRPPWVPLSVSAAFLLRKKRLLGWSAMLVLATALLTWTGFWFTTDLFDSLTGSFFSAEPERQSFLDWFVYVGWYLSRWVFLLVSRVIAFFLAFLAAYTITAPLYVFLSTAAEKIYSGDRFEPDDGLSLSGVVMDLWEGVKIGLFGIVVTVVALAVSFAPLIGQVAVFLLYVFYSALMFVDYPASRRRWNLGRKIGWLRRHPGQSFRLGVVPALLSLIPILNIFLIALIFPLFTVHATLNFYVIEEAERFPVEPGNAPHSNLKPTPP